MNAPDHRDLIVLESVSRKYELGSVTVTALDEINLHIDEGEFVVVLGPSGSGKTTLINLIGSLDTPTDGRIQVGEVDVTGAGRKELFEYRRHLVSFIFQSFNIFPGLTAEENVQFGIDAAERKTGPTAHQVLANVGLADRANHFPHELSGGEQQRVAIARALATGNPILLADEPTGELDFKTGVQILELLKAQAGPDTAVVVVTHNREISRIADRVVELSSGRIEHDGPPRDGRAEMSDLHW